MSMPQWPGASGHCGIFPFWKMFHPSVVLTRLRLKPPSEKPLMGGGSSLLHPRPLAAAAKPWLHGKFDTFVHIQAVQSWLVVLLLSAGMAGAQVSVTAP